MEEAINAGESAVWRRRAGQLQGRALSGHGPRSLAGSDAADMDRLGWAHIADNNWTAGRRLDPGGSADWLSERYRDSRPIIDKAAVAAGRDPAEIVAVFNFGSRITVGGGTGDPRQRWALGGGLGRTVGRRADHGGPGAWGRRVVYREGGTRPSEHALRALGRGDRSGGARADRPDLNSRRHTRGSGWLGPGGSGHGADHVEGEVNAPVDRIFGFVDDHRNTTRYMKGLTQWSPPPTSSTGKGAEFEVVMKAGPASLARSCASPDGARTAPSPGVRSRRVSRRVAGGHSALRGDPDDGHPGHGVRVWRRHRGADAGQGGRAGRAPRPGAVGRCPQRTDRETPSRAGEERAVETSRGQTGEAETPGSAIGRGGE